MKEVDYSDRAVTLRIHRVSQLRNLCLELKKAGEVLRKPSHTPLPGPDRICDGPEGVRVVRDDETAAAPEE
jgi:hypothetical protein